MSPSERRSPDAEIVRHMEDALSAKIARADKRKQQLVTERRKRVQSHNSLRNERHSSPAKARESIEAAETAYIARSAQATQRRNMLLSERAARARRQSDERKVPQEGKSKNSQCEKGQTTRPSSARKHRAQKMRRTRPVTVESRILSKRVEKMLAQIASGGRRRIDIAAKEIEQGL